MSLTMARPEAAESVGAVLRVAVYDTVAASEPAWQALYASAPASPYQAYAWVQAWCASNLASGLVPAIAVAFDEPGNPVALLPFGRMLRGRVTIGCFLGGKDTNCNMGLWSERVAWSVADVRTLIEAVGRSAGLDMIALTNQPLSWKARNNPLLALGVQASPGNARSVSLQGDPHRHFESTLSKHARKNLRQKDGKLRRLGPVEHRRATTPAEVEHFVACYIRFKTVRFEAMGVTALAEPEGFALFLTAAATLPLEGPPVEVHALMCGADVVAVLAGAADGRHFAAMVLAFDDRPDVAKCSPGDLLVAAVMADLCRRGFEDFDLGIGDARYKDTFCPDIDTRVDCFVAFTLRGQLAMRTLKTATRLKGALKRSPRAWSLVCRVRRWRAHFAAVRGRVSRTR